MPNKGSKAVTETERAPRQTEHRATAPAGEGSTPLWAADERTRHALLAHLRHNLRSPLNAILGYAEMLIEDAEAEGQPDLLPDLQRVHAAGTELVSRLSEVLDPARFEAEPIETHTFAAPIGDTIYYFMTASGNTLSFSVGSVVGVVIGATLGSYSKGHFRWEACEDPRELRRQILGAALMGPGAILAVGCSVGQGISAFSTLDYSAPVAFIAIYAGAAFGLRQLITGLAPAE